MTVTKHKTYKNSDILDFCNITGDNHFFHDPEFMKNRGKKPIIPGIQVLLTAIALEEEKLSSNQPAYLEANFGNMLFPGSIIRHQAVEGHNPGNTYFTAQTTNTEGPTKDLLTSEDKHGNKEKTYLQTNSKLVSIIEDLEGRTHAYLIDRGLEKYFASTLGLKDPKTIRLLYSIALASNAIINTGRDIQNDEAIKALRTEDESELAKRLMDTKREPLPAYTSLSLTLPEQDTKPGDDRLVYTVRTEFMPEKTGTFDVQCEQNGNLLFQGTYNITLIPKKVLFRMAEHLEEK
ncbi:MaoC family dehydratase [Candidatus Woesearchaeota archaeon]|nr:MaoC family dehydratase [Candidatus Woesearchaeota archaeon]